MLEGQSAQMKQFSPEVREGGPSKSEDGRPPCFPRDCLRAAMPHASSDSRTSTPPEGMRCPFNSTRTPRVRVLTVSAKLLKPICTGEVSERFKEHAWKACVGEILPWVQIPPSPPYF